MQIEDDPQGPPLTFTYKNWRGETGIRRAVPNHMWYGRTEHHPEAQWFMNAWDVDKQALRDFAVLDCAFERVG